MEAPKLRLSAAGLTGTRSLVGAAAVLTALTTVRLGEHRALSTSRDLADANERPTLVFLFQPEDCARYGGLVRRWNALAREGALRVVGVGIGFPASRGARDSILGTTRPFFPVRYDLGRSGERLLARVGHLRTPTTVLLDGLGRPLLILPPDGVEDPALQEAERLIREYASRSTRRGP